MSNKELIQAFYKEFFNDHDIDSAIKYVREDYIQHNPGVSQGRQGLMDGFREKFKTEPTAESLLFPYGGRRSLRCADCA